MKTVEIKCDACGGDLTDAGSMPTFRLSLQAEAVANSGNFMYAIAVHPELRRTYHFCRLNCLDLWRDRERLRAKLSREWWEKWRNEHGTKDESGRVRSYPTPPDDVFQAAKAEFESAALAAFPMHGGAA